jgi:glycolate oxidase FAD binding subunit
MDYRGLLQTTGEPTIGGVVAANVSGPRRISVGACRDFALGVRYVDGAGQIIKNGGRVMKNVTGYDLVKLMSGSRGTLGILTEVSLKVLPQPETEATVILHAPKDADAAVQAMSRALGSPYDVTGAAYRPSDADVVLRVEGFAESVAYRAGKLRDELKSFGELTVSDDAATSADIWREIRDVSRMHGAAGDVWRLSVKPTDAPDVADRLGALDAIYDWGGGLIWALVPEGTDVRAKAGSFDGHATLVRASSDTRAQLGMFQPEPAPVAAISAGLRARFDPRGMLNAGLMG